MLRGFGVERRMVTHQRAKTGWNSLTESELKVVHLAAQGAINRDIAEQLHLSPHTVKAHLRNAYAKLGVNTRLELRQLVSGVDRPSASHIAARSSLWPPISSSYGRDRELAWIVAIIAAPTDVCDLRLIKATSLRGPGGTNND